MLQKTYTENDRSRDFWENFDEYHDMVRDYYRGLEITYPRYDVTSRGQCICLDYVNSCSFARSNVRYYENTGESI